MYDYQFPAVTLETTDSEQVRKLREETNEFFSASGIYGYEDDEKAKLDPLGVSTCIELLDVIHACETLLRRFNPAIAAACSEIVEAKNRARGYYNAKTDFGQTAREIIADDYVNGRC